MLCLCKATRTFLISTALGISLEEYRVAFKHMTRTGGKARDKLRISCFGVTWHMVCKKTNQTDTILDPAPDNLKHLSSPNRSIFQLITITPWGIPSHSLQHCCRLCICVCNGRQIGKYKVLWLNKRHPSLPRQVVCLKLRGGEKRSFIF